MSNRSIYVHNFKQTLKITLLFILVACITNAQINVVCSTPKIGNISNILNFTGETKPILETYAAADVTGPIQKVLIEDGMKVKAGQPLVLIEKIRFELLKRQTEASLKIAKQTLKEAQKDFDRNKTLFVKGAITQKKFDNVETALVRAESTYQLEKANYDRNNLDLARCYINSPIDGYFVNRAVDPGQAIRRGQNIGKVIDISSIYVDAKISDSDINKISIGQKCTIEDKYIGEIAYINLYADKSRSFKVRIKVANPNLVFKANMFVKGSITLKRYTNVPLYSENALRAESGSYYLFLNKNGKALKKRVTIIARREGEVYSPEISKDSKIVVTGQDMLENGSKLVVNTNVPEALAK